MPPFRKVLGPDFERLPPALRELHGSGVARDWIGRADARRGDGLIARLTAALIGFPRAGTDIPLRVVIAPEGDGERWTREFDGKAFTSVLRPGSDRNEPLLLERFGTIEIALALVVDGARLRFVPRRWSWLGIPLPRFLVPFGATFECERNGRFAFDVEIGAPVVGLIVAYRGQLDPA